MGVDFADVESFPYRFIRSVGEGGAAPVWLAVDTIASEQGDATRQLAIKLFGCEEAPGQSINELVEQLRGDVTPLIILQHDPAIRDHITRFVATTHLSGCIVEESPGKRAFYEAANIPRDKPVQKATILGAAMDYVAQGSIERSEYRRYCATRSGAFLADLASLARAIHKAHQYQQRFVHCDIKPHNILWDHQDHHDYLVLADWGISRRMKASGIVEYEAGGTPEYMAPEAFEESAATWHRDAYAFGATLYHIFCGRPPFVQKDYAKLHGVPRVAAYRNLHSDEALRDRIRLVGNETDGLKCSYGLERLVVQLLSIEKEKRLSFDAIADALEHEYQQYRRPVERRNEMERLVVAIPEQPQCDLKPVVTFPFRALVRQQIPYFLFLELPRRGGKEIEALFRTLEFFLGRHFWCIETFGRFDFCIKMWDDTSGRNLRDLCDELLGHLLGGTKSHILTLPCVDVVVCAKNSARLHDSLAEDKMARANAMRELYGIQSKPTLEWTKHDLAIAKRLDKLGVIQLSKRMSLKHPSHLDPFMKESIPCICLVHSAVRDSSEFVGKPELLMKVFDRTAPPEILESIQIYHAGRVDIGHLEKLEAHMAITYIAPKYSDVRVVPKLIFAAQDQDNGEDRGDRFPHVRTWTMPATRNYAAIYEAMEVIPSRE